MKLKFIKQPFQTAAVNSVADLFIGQEKKTATFSIVRGERPTLLENQYGIGNALLIDDAAMLANLRAIQKRNTLPQSSALEGKQFSVEMETGTGKTYVYTQTIFELNKRFGFTKFIIVVPSVAIREGVYKSLQVTQDHFGLLYNNTPSRYFIYNSARLSDVRQFATSANIEIMIINIDAFKKAENVINQAQDRLSGESAMRFIRDTCPIVIIDEPQSVDNTPKSKEAIASLNPFCVLRYSATHREKVNLLFRLTPVDAYQMGLVKQICVSSNQVAHGFNKPYIKLLSVTKDHKGYRAKVEMDVRGKDGKVARKNVTLKPNSDLFVLSGQRDLYEGYAVVGIDCTPGYECVEFGNTEFLELGRTIGGIDENIIKRAQIRRTIEVHFEKEMRFAKKGIKVLSLFFIDEVKKYRTPEGGRGPYAEMFEECYHELLNLPKYAELKERFRNPVEKVHDGYFSQDKKGNYKDTRGDTLDDYTTYNTIMKDKERLLSFECPLRFIFSHSALKEGWDNPNVFQVCTLIEQKSAFTCRQKVGRGLRLCVNQDGERIEDKDINLLHVMANESFAEFAATLQKEIEDETGVKFGVLQLSLFAGMTYTDTIEEQKILEPEDAARIVSHLEKQGYISPEGQAQPTLQVAVEKDCLELPKEVAAATVEVAKVITTATAKAAPVTAAALKSALSGTIYTRTVRTEKTISYEDAQELLNHLQQKGYTDKSGKIKDTLKNALKTGTLDLPAKFEAAREKFEQIIANADRRPPLRDASKDVMVKLKKQVTASPEFLELWNKIKQKTTYRVNIDSAALISQCVKDLRDMELIPKARLVSQTANINIESAGVSHQETGMRTTDIRDSYNKMPDVLAVIGEQTLTKRATVCEILLQSGRLRDLSNNPQLFIERCVEIIRNRRHQLAVDGISYLKLAGQEYYTQEIFDSEELIANLEKNAVAVANSVYDHIIYDSDTVERPFALALDNDPDVKMFFKIPRAFKIETPIGTYNPDWAVYLNRNGEKKLYFVLETKGDTSLFNLRTPEVLKIHCGKRHFAALENGVELRVAREWKKFRLEV
uniref:type III restriction-modification system endonuclease n=1 Tax=uncultured Bilophila sp. TaxID=529385 RepID=UPI0025E0254E|nr:DEAD/DEAH box helicase family protein [uncultured Bilophila sp.]